MSPEVSPEVSAAAAGDDGSEARDARDARVVLLVRAQCPTCVRMEDVVRAVCDAAGERWTVVDVGAPDADPELRAEYADVVPVTLVDGHELASWSLEPATLRAALGPGRADR